MRSRSLSFPLRFLVMILVASVFPPGTVAAQTVTYIHTDALGSVVAETDANGKVIKRYDYEPYGAVVGGQVTDGPGYTGHVSDSATGLSYMQQRYMDPQLGVFLSVDPVTAYDQPVGQFNRYRYANGNPYKFTDPDGRNALLAAPLVVVPIVIGLTYYATTTAEQRTDIGNKLDGAVKGLLQKSEESPRLPALQGDGSIARDKQSPKIESSAGEKKETGTIYVDSKGNAIPTPPGGKIEGSPDGRFVQAKGPDGQPTGVRIDGGHKPSTHPDPRAQQPHGHVPGVTNADGTPWLPIKQ
ncbi:RHS repeat-associated core domain-containing protein [Stenotrophomonas maltophilia]|jgi:RHS repeat-associated protein|uniref:RHS repeat-associated core domain-containing protein n=1 Tax=Stenotrophomonas maltophilia TaxID=40324 RepID=UPI001311B7DE|nr:RHS repeat-associated core domain-containing protein [Stenotrophomonas maltophilia]MBH1657045.1 RHS repeat-associated core domain-containing protein [Stenotrophomonas maltophilia]MBH1845670.1 RHS repeat-associated core domain-containing protein [Stenotrophomonas maltophilia]HEL3255806.1 RHS repeat-associated core domain-containing protein [Stenotrophomonas maltophilia]